MALCKIVLDLLLLGNAVVLVSDAIDDLCIHFANGRYSICEKMHVISMAQSVR